MIILHGTKKCRYLKIATRDYEESILDEERFHKICKKHAKCSKFNLSNLNPITRLVNIEMCNLCFYELYTNNNDTYMNYITEHHVPTQI